MQQKHVLVVGGRDHTLDKLDKLGVRYSMMQTPDLVTDKQVRDSERYVVMDYRDVEEVLLVARAWHAKDPFDAIVSLAEYGMHAASLCAIDLQLPGDNLSAVQLTRDKIHMRAAMEQHRLSPVRYQTCARLEDALAFLHSLDGQPMVLKPFDGGGSEGVFYVENEAALRERWPLTQAATASPILAEEFLEGPEFSVESISRNGRHEIAIITEKITTELPTFVELGHQVPARLAPADKAAIESLVLGFLEVVGQRTAPAHTEIRLTRSGPRIIESQTRIGGDQIWEMCEMVSGVDLMSETICELLSLPQPPRQPVASAAAIRFFPLQHARIVKVENLEQAERAPGIVRVKCTLKPGQELGRLSGSDSRQGYVLCTGKDIDEAMLNAETGRDLVKVEWEPLPATV
ncbi:ATP-grasp domain-containing protein [Chromobacterium alticapitis]|uniref:Phosphoribosylglycinamide synthetase n=1 Tax=Chromobacterium alticapitis TaxID=2073169 RepID=A0A2S5DG78_9NEIS|nr:ATP-grasp domain-containing protein [Chromobacterium alticapitis]POZ62054.1 phosphoribosylglycinamide synthetase [Chromobacterium alticapitis]